MDARGAETETENPKSNTNPRPKPKTLRSFMRFRQNEGLESLPSGMTYLDEVIEEHGSHGGQSEPDEHGEGRDARDVQGVEQVRCDNGRRLAEQEGHE